MSERLTALYQGKPICVFEILDGNRQYLEEGRSELRLASQSGKLICPECGSRLVFCAGAVREPYFRHFSLEDCPATFALRTVAGRRSYFCRRLLYEVAKGDFIQNLSIDEKRESDLKPVVFEAEGQKIGYVYLDENGRIYNELYKSISSYKEKGYRLFFFLSMRNMSNGRNLTSDEAETARLNGGIICYVDEKEEKLAMRKQYVDANGVRQNYTKVFHRKEMGIPFLPAADDIDKVPFYENCEATKFLQQFTRMEREEKLKFSKVQRIPLEDGIDEIYFEMDYVMMDSLGEIWVLPDFLYVMNDSNHTLTQARQRRMDYLVDKNEELRELPTSEQNYTAHLITKEIEKNRNSWDW